MDLYLIVILRNINAFSIFFEPEICSVLGFISPQ